MNPRRNRGRRLQTGLRDGGGGSFSPLSIPNLKLWLRSDLGVTQVISPVTSAGTTPPAVTITGTLAAGDAQTAAATPYVEIDVNDVTGGTGLGQAKFQWKINGTTQQTGQVTAASFPLGTTGLTAAFPAGPYANNNTYTANIVVSAWADQSGNGNNATQATGSKRPQYLVPDAGYNNQPTLVFNSANSQNLTLVSVLPAQPFTAFVVGQSTSGAGQEQFFGDSTNNVMLYWGGSSWNMFAGSVLASANATQNSRLAFAAIFNTTTSSLYINTSSAAAASGTVNTSNPAGTEDIANQNGASHFLNGKIAEMLVYKGAVSTTTVKQVFSYLAARFNPGGWS